MVALGAGKERALLAVLLLQRGEVVSSDRLIDALWGEHPPATAAKSLQVHVSHLRKALGAGPIVTRGHGYLLATAPDELDVDRFERAADAGRRLLAAGEAERAAATLTEGLRMWCGPPLADFAYEPFAATEAARLAELRIAALEDRIDADAALGRHAALVAELEALVRAHPFRERLRGQLMLALYRCGRPTRSTATARAARRSSASSVWSRGASCVGSSRRSSGRTPSSTARAAPERAFPRVGGAAPGWSWRRPGRRSSWPRSRSRRSSATGLRAARPPCSPPTRSAPSIHRPARWSRGFRSRVPPTASPFAARPSGRSATRRAR